MKYFVLSLEHMYEDDEHRDMKFLGYFDDEEKLELAKIDALKLSGFSDYPNGFYSKKIELDLVHWNDGFENVVGEIGRDYLIKEDLIPENFRSIKELNLEMVFQVSHIYTINTFLDDERKIGVFQDEYKCQNVVEELKEKRGFINFPDNFIVDEITLNQLLWQSGF